jgi:uncharacterized phage protein (TIGR01671 family)
MSKEIKFKYIWSNPEKTNFITEIFTLDEIEAGNQFTVLENEPLLKDYKLIARVQFTGLHDKNGKEIFVGDVVEYIERLPVFPIKRIAVVQFIGGNVDYANNFLINPFVNITSFNYKTNCITGVMNNPAESVIIGNIYQNPELL